MNCYRNSLEHESRPERKSFTGESLWFPARFRQGMPSNLTRIVIDQTKHGFWITSMIFISLCYGCQSGDRPDEATVLPNIILVMADDQGWGDMSFNGHPELKTPHFDRAARECLQFSRFYAAAPVCSPTRASVMTGRHPNRMGAFNWGHTLRPQEFTLAERLQKLGYTTGHFGKWHLGSVQSGSPVNPGHSGFDEWFSAPNFFENDPILSREGKAVETNGESSEVTVDAALDFIKKYHQMGQPYFAVIWFGSPHAPHIAAPVDFDAYPEIMDSSLRHFYGEITGMDRAYGKLRTQVRNLSHHEHTVIWYCSDNGGLPKLGSTGGRGHKGQIYEGGLRVPAIVDWPARIKKPMRISFPCNTSDILPTVMEIAGEPIHDDLPLDGVSLVPAITQGIDFISRGMGFWQYPRRGVRTPSYLWMPELLAAQEHGQMHTDSFRLRLDAGDLSEKFTLDSTQGHSAWLEWPWKLHRIKRVNEDAVFELYHLEQDSMELNDLLLEENQRAEKMKLALSNWQRSVIASLNGSDY